MKKPYFPLLLLILAIFSCTHHEKKVYAYDGSSISEYLSDISKEIIAIPLETTSICKINKVRQVQRVGSDIFLLNDNEICRFNRSGSFINKISLDNTGWISNYTINSDNRQIIILDSLHQLHYYSYDGNKLSQKDVSHSPLWQTLYKVVYHKQALWAIAENITADNHYQKWLYKLDPDFNLMEGTQLCNADLGRFYLEGHFTPELSVIDDMIYVYSPLSYKETILQDTHYLISNLSHEQNLIKLTSKPKLVYTLPVRINRRFVLASYQANYNEKENYLFCFDQVKNKAYPFHGFIDNFYKTGLVNNLQALDIYNNQFYFYKSGQDVIESFPDRTPDDNPVLFFVTLKS